MAHSWIRWVLWSPTERQRHVQKLSERIRILPIGRYELKPNIPTAVLHIRATQLKREARLPKDSIHDLCKGRHEPLRSEAHFLTIEVPIGIILKGNARCAFGAGISFGAGDSEAGDMLPVQPRPCGPESMVVHQLDAPVTVVRDVDTNVTAPRVGICVPERFPLPS